MNAASLLDELARRPLCCDGAMGTQLLARGLGSGECGMRWNLYQPDQVVGIHRAYREAGCELITTNSFGGSHFALELHGLAHDVAKLNQAAACLARAAAGETGWVLGDVGPFGGFLEPIGDTPPQELRAALCEQITALIGGGADAILIETMSDPAEAIIGLEAARQCDQKIPIIVTYTFLKGATGEFRTMMGTTVGEAMQRTIAAGANVVGTNCGTGLNLDDYVELTKHLVAEAGQTPVIVQPNAGKPHTEDGNTIYDVTPEEMAAAAKRLLAAGASIIGGCCGTTPRHLAAMSQAIRKRKA